MEFASDYKSARLTSMLKRVDTLGGGVERLFTEQIEKLALFKSNKLLSIYLALLFTSIFPKTIKTTIPTRVTSMDRFSREGFSNHIAARYPPMDISPIEIKTMDEKVGSRLASAFSFS
jgi:hypothetical protein